MIDIATLVLVALLGSLAIGGGARAQRAEATRAASRRMIAGSWSLVGTTDPSRASPGDVQTLDIADGLVVTYDYVGHQIKAFDFHGAPAWQIGGPGHRQGQFANVVDIQHDARGNFWAVDPLPERVTVISRLGTVVRTYEKVGKWWRVAPRSDGLVWAFVPTDSAPGLYDTTGHQRSVLSLSSNLSRLEFPANQLALTPGPRDAVLVTYSFSDRFVIVGANGINPREFRGIELHDFPAVVRTSRVINGNAITVPKVDSEATVVVGSAAWDGSHIYLLTSSSGTGGGTRSIVDSYSSVSGAYEGSRYLPARVEALAVKGDTCAAIVRGPTSEIRIWAWTASHDPRRK